MATKNNGLLSIIKKNESLSFGLIQNSKGEEHYKDDFIDISADNFEEEANSGYYSGVELSIYSEDDIKGIDKLAGEKDAWAFSLPIVSLHIQGITEKILKNLISVIGENLKDLTIDFSDIGKLNTDFIVKNCKTLKKLTLCGSSWDEDKPIKIDFVDIDKIHLDFLKIETSTDNKSIDFSKVNILELEIDNCDSSKMKYPSNLETLKIFANGNSFESSNLSNLKKLDLSLGSNCSFNNLQQFSKLDNLKEIELNLGGEKDDFKIALPSKIESFLLNTDGKKCDLNFLENYKSLKKLNIRTDVYNSGEPFKNINSISNLINLEELTLTENGLGVDKFKSEFTTKIISSLMNLKQLKLDGMLGVKDFSDLQKLTNLEKIEIRNSKIETLKGIESLSGLKNIVFDDCYSIFDFSPLKNITLDKIVFNLSDHWATPIKIKKENILAFNELKINRVTIYIEKMKFAKKDYVSLSKKYEIDIDGNQIDLTLLK